MRTLVSWRPARTARVANRQARADTCQLSVNNSAVQDTYGHVSHVSYLGPICYEKEALNPVQLFPSEQLFPCTCQEILNGVKPREILAT